MIARVGETRFASVRRSNVRSLDGMNGFGCLVRPRGDGREQKGTRCKLEAVGDMEECLVVRVTMCS